MKNKNMDISESRFLPFVSALEVAFTAGFGAVITLDAERQRLEEGYETARILVRAVEFDAGPLAVAT